MPHRQNRKKYFDKKPEINIVAKGYSERWSRVRYSWSDWSDATVNLSTTADANTTEPTTWYAVMHPSAYTDLVGSDAAFTSTETPTTNIPLRFTRYVPVTYDGSITVTWSTE